MSGAIKSPNLLISTGSQDGGGTVIGAQSAAAAAQQPPTTPVLKNVGILMPGSIGAGQIGACGM